MLRPSSHPALYSSIQLAKNCVLYIGDTPDNCWILTDGREEKASVNGKCILPFRLDAADSWTLQQNINRIYRLRLQLKDAILQAGRIASHGQDLPLRPTDELRAYINATILDFREDAMQGLPQARRNLLVRSPIILLNLVLIGIATGHNLVVNVFSNLHNYYRRMRCKSLCFQANDRVKQLKQNLEDQIIVTEIIAIQTVHRLPRRGAQLNVPYNAKTSPSSEEKMSASVKDLRVNIPDWTARKSVVLLREDESPIPGFMSPKR